MKIIQKITLTQWIFISLVAGLLLGVYAPAWVPMIRPFRGLFLNGVKCIIAPLIFSTLVSGIAGAGSFKQLGKMGLKSIIYFEVVTTLALAVGLVLVNWLNPGGGVTISGQLTGAALQAAQTQISAGGFIEHLLPSSIAEAVVKGDVLQIVVFSTIFALGALAVGERARPVVAFCESLGDIMFRVTGLIMYLAPLGVGAAMAASVADHGSHVLIPMFKLVGSLYFALAVFIAIVLVPVCKLFRIPVLEFGRRVKAPFLLAFATTSSESAYPLALESLEKFGVPRRISSFVLPLGYSFNLDGSTLYLAMASVFIAQAAGIHQTLGQQLAMMLALMLTTKGVAAVPRASIVVLSATLTSFGLPLEGIALILGVDAFMDMARTAVNLLGNCLATAVIARTEGIELPSRTSEAVVTPVETLAEAAWNDEIGTDDPALDSAPKRAGYREPIAE